jgi:protein-tyrosine phosphatase
MVNARFGTFRGAVRLALSYGQVALGQSCVRPGNAGDVKRLVFVCHGNICRSAFADIAARALGLNATSFGLSTSTDLPAHPPAAAAAAKLGHDLSAHRTQRAEDYVPLPGDLLLAMEVRQLRRLSRDPRLHGVPRSLLGLWAEPKIPHLHDPYQLDAAYMDICLRRIDTAVTGLANAFSGARLS